MGLLILFVSENVQFLLIAGAVTSIFLIFLLSVISRGQESGNKVKSKAYIESLKNIIEGKMEKAIDALTRVVKNDPDSIDIYYIIGNLMRLVGKTDRAISIHRNILLQEKLDEKKRNETIRSLALDLKKAGQFEKAIKELEILVKKDPDNISNLRVLEELYLETNDIEKAYSLRLKISKLLKKSSHNILSHLLVIMGNKAEEKGNIGIAKKLYKKAISLHNLSEDALLNHARLLLKDGDFDATERTLLSIWEINPPLSFITLPMLEEVYFKKGKFAEYGDLLASQLEKNPDLVRVRFALAKFYINMGRVDEGEKELRTILDKAPEMVEAWEEFIKILINRGEKEKVENALKTFFHLIRKENIFSCKECGFAAKEVFWHCPNCKKWDTVQVTN